MEKKDIDIVKENYDNNANAEWERLEGFHNARRFSAGGSPLSPP